jgi:hypothetical protein
VPEEVFIGAAPPYPRTVVLGKEVDMKIKKLLSSFHEGHMWIGLWALIAIGILIGAILRGLSLIQHWTAGKPWNYCVGR